MQYPISFIKEKSMEQFFQVGVISSTHGVRGEVKVYPTTDDPARFRRLKEVLLDNGRTRVPVQIEGVRFFKQMVIVKFKGYDSLNDVEQLRRASLFVPREEAVPLEEDEYYVADLLGMDVVTENEKPFGRIADVLQTAANDVYVIKSPQYGEVLVPAIAECILQVSLEDNRMKIHILDGLIN